MAKTYQLSELNKLFGFHSSKTVQFLEARGIKPVRTTTTAAGYKYREYGRDAYELTQKYRVYKEAKAANRFPVSFAYVSMEKALEWLKEQDELAAIKQLEQEAQTTLGKQEETPLVTPKMVADAMMTASENATPEMTFEVIADPDSLRSMVKRVTEDLSEVKAMLANIQRELGAVSIPGFDDEATTHSNGRSHN